MRERDRGDLGVGSTWMLDRRLNGCMVRGRLDRAMELHTVLRQRNGPAIVMGQFIAFRYVEVGGLASSETIAMVDDSRQDATRQCSGLAG